jgi:hypothetical protein
MFEYAFFACEFACPPAFSRSAGNRLACFFCKSASNWGGFLLPTFLLSIQRKVGCRRAPPAFKIKLREANQLGPHCIRKLGAWKIPTAHLSFTYVGSAPTGGYFFARAKKVTKKSRPAAGPFAKNAKGSPVLLRKVGGRAQHRTPSGFIMHTSTHSARSRQLATAKYAHSNSHSLPPTFLAMLGCAGGNPP